METLGETLAEKAIETLRSSRASKIKRRYYWRHTRNKKANGLFNALDYRLPQVSSYYAGDQRKDEGLKDILGNKVAKKKTGWP